MITVDGLTVEFGGTTLFKDISFQINEKDRIALMGKNGVGDVEVPGGGDENQIGLLLVEHHLVGFLALIEGSARRFRIPAAVDVGDTDNLIAFNRA